MTESNTQAAPEIQIYRIYIRATPEAIWNAITSREWAERYGYRAPVEYDLRPGGKFTGYASEAMMEHGDAPGVIIEGEVLEVDPPRRLVQTWKVLWFDEPATTLTYEIDDDEEGVSRLTVTHDLTGAPQTALQTAGMIDGAGGGWSQVFSDLKTLLETSNSLYG